MASSTADRYTPLQAVRETLRKILMASPEYQRLDASTRREIAQGLVKICLTAVGLDSKVDTALDEARQDSRTPFALTQSAGSEFSGVATQRVAETTQQILNAVSFPRFVTELINGVFKALVDSNQQQLTSYVDLIRNVAVSTDGFAQANVGLDGARQWLVERFPGSFIIEGETDPFAEPAQQLTPEEQAERDAEKRLRLRPGAAMPPEAALRAGLGLGPNESVPSGDPENLVALARSTLARNRQQMLSTMIMLGLQRIVIESGRLHASMRFHIDTRSAAHEDRGSQLDARHTSTVSGSFGYGPWGASASMTNTIGYVSTQKTQTTEEMNTDLNLDSSVELVFKTDYLPLDRLAGREHVDRIKVNTLNPEAEWKADVDARAARGKQITESETKRRESIDKSIAPPPVPANPAPGAPGSPEAAEKARKEAEERDRKKKKEEEDKKKTQTTTSTTPSGQQQPLAQQPQTQQPPAQQSQTGGTPRFGTGTNQKEALGDAKQPSAKGGQRQTKASDAQKAKTGVQSPG